MTPHDSYPPEPEDATPSERPVEPKLAKWVSLSDRLQSARALLKAQQAVPGGVVSEELVHEVEWLRRLSGVALQDLIDEYERQKENAG